MADLNKVFLIGRLTDDPKPLRVTSGGAPVTDLRLATSRQYTSKDGTPQKETLYIDVTVWHRQAENCCKYLQKGRLVHVEGYLKQENWEDKATGAPRSKIKVEAERVQFLDGRRDDAGGGGGPAPASQFDDDEYTPTAPEPRRSAPEPRGGNGPSRGLAGGVASRRPTSPPAAAGDDDDIPF
jgi:single-strand DNA-binding protein